MPKVSQLTDKEIDEMIQKYEKLLQALYREKEKRVGHVLAQKMTFPLASPVEPDSVPQPTKVTSSGSYQFVVDEDMISEAKAENKLADKEETSEMRLTRVLKLSRADLEKFNSAVEKKNKKK